MSEAEELWEELLTCAELSSSITRPPLAMCISFVKNCTYINIEIGSSKLCMYVDTLKEKKNEESDTKLFYMNMYSKFQVNERLLHHVTALQN